MFGLIGFYAEIVCRFVEKLIIKILKLLNMKANKILHSLAVAAMVCAVTVFTSCKKEPLPLPEVIESEVYDNGTAGNVQSSPVENGTQMSYESWINVRGITKGSFDNRVAVTLYGYTYDVNSTVDVATWEMGETLTSTNFEIGETRTEGFVTIVDSILVYTVRSEQFEFNYKLHYEVGTYDDGVSRQVMPYHYFKNIRDNGGVLEDAESYVDGEAAYARKIYRHSITVDFGGESYDVVAEITLRRYLGPANEPYPLKSKILEKTIEPLSSKDGFISSVKVESVMSTGNTETSSYSVSLPTGASDVYGNAKDVSSRLEDVHFQKAVITEEEESYAGGDGYMSLMRIDGKCILQYNQFDIEIDIYRHTAIFDNGILREKVAEKEFNAEAVKILEEKWTKEEERNNYVSYYLELKVEIPIGELTVLGGYSGVFYMAK